MTTSIFSLTNNLIKDLYKKTREYSNHYFVVESINLLKELANKKFKIKYLLITQEFLDNNLWIKEQENIIVTSYQIIKKISFTINPPECIAVIEYSIPKFEINTDNYLILDNLKDPGNLATIIRSSLAFGINKIFISNNSVSPYNDKVFRSTMGAILNIKINYYDNLSNLVKELESKQIECIASCIDKQASKLDEYKPTKKHVAIILGNESNGINKNDLTSIKNKVYIDIDNVNSLNVASACAIFLFQFKLWNK